MENTWQIWMAETTAALRNIQDPVAREGGWGFLDRHYKRNQPGLFGLPEWPAFGWTLETMVNKVGAETIVQFQGDRNCDPDYEIRAEDHRKTDTFGNFIKLVKHCDGNDVYMTAQNTGVNANAIAPLYRDLHPQPQWLGLDGTKDAGFFWIGADTMTPLHHDLTNNLMCQIIGTKVVRVVPPSQFDKLQWRGGVHSSLGWLDVDTARQHGIHYFDYMLSPRRALFLPVGWWHCVKAYGASVTVVFTNFRWNNHFGHNFSC